MFLSILSMKHGWINKNSKAYLMLVFITLFWAGNPTIVKSGSIEKVSNFSLKKELENATKEIRLKSLKKV